MRKYTLTGEDGELLSTLPGDGPRALRVSFSFTAGDLASLLSAFQDFLLAEGFVLGGRHLDLVGDDE